MSRRVTASTRGWPPEDPDGDRMKTIASSSALLASAHRPVRSRPAPAIAHAGAAGRKATPGGCSKRHEREPGTIRRAQAPTQPRAPHVDSRGGTAWRMATNRRAVPHRPSPMYLHGTHWLHLGRERRAAPGGRGRHWRRRSWPAPAHREQHLEPRVPSGGDRCRPGRRHALGHRLLLRLVPGDRWRLSAVEVFRPDVVQELAELLDLFLLVARDQDRASSSTSSLREDRHRHPDGQRDGVGGPRRDLERPALGASARSWRRTWTRGAPSRRCAAPAPADPPGSSSSDRGSSAAASRTPWSDRAIAAASAAPIQMGRYRSPSRSRSSTIGWFVGSSTRTPVSSISIIGSRRA